MSETTTSAETKQYLSAKELSMRWDGRPSERTLNNWRTLGKGPKFLKLGGIVLYPTEEVEAWEKANSYSSTSNYKAS